MQKLVELLNKHWEYKTDPKGNEPKNNSEQKIAILIGRSILINNLKVLDINEGNRERVIKKYDEIFNTESIDGTLPLGSHEIINPLEYDVIGRVYESHIHNNGTRKSSGQFYSPIQAVNYIIEELKLSDIDLKDLKSKRFIDIACGTGVFLLSAFKNYTNVLKEKGVEANKALELGLSNIYGLDINPVSCIITKINLFNLIVVEFEPEAIFNLKDFKFNIYNTNSIENRPDIFDSASPTVSYKIKLKMNEFSTGFDYIIGNPPYLEAKKMPKELKDLCRANFGDDIFGAFDLYIAFLSQCNRLVAENGKISLILPNKFTVAKYAKKLRKKLLDHYTLIDLVDLSEMDIFSKADVYPIIFSYMNALPMENHEVSTKMSIKNYIDLFNEDYITPVPQKLYKQIGDMNTFFCLPKNGEFDKFFVDLFLQHESITQFLEFRSTVSFHKKGLREQYVRQEFEGDGIDSSNIKKYLGGLSYSKKNEVERYNINWNNYYINYDNLKLKSIGNSLPPLENFEQTKIIFCQHAKEIIATYDEKGEWVTKDVYPIAFPKPEIEDTVLSVKYLVGLLNSKLYSFLYGIIYKGIQIAGGYYHFLPTWMSTLPIIIPNEADVKIVEELVDKAMSSPKDNDLIIKELDNKIFEIYSVNKEQRDVIYSFLGYEVTTKELVLN